MDYIYEAVYFFNKINICINNKEPLLINQEEYKRLGINESLYKAIMRILVVSNLLDYNGSCFVMTIEHKIKHRYILDKISKIQSQDYEKLFNKAVNESQFFFNCISELEYEIYSRCNFPITFETGKELIQHINFTNTKVLELGGNSGGLGSAIIEGSKNCLFTVVDAKIPCMVGNEFKEINNLNITFIEGNVFELALSSEVYNYIIIMNLLHDFDDKKCLSIIQNCLKYCDINTRFLIIEDILTGEFEPKDVIIHGLRLSIECRGGKQRTIKEIEGLFSNINYKLEQTIKINNIHTMLIMGSL